MPSYKPFAQLPPSAKLCASLLFLVNKHLVNVSGFQK